MAYRAAVVGGSGYTGAELLRLLAGHPEIEVVHVTADSNAGTAGRGPVSVAGQGLPAPRLRGGSTPPHSTGSTSSSSALPARRVPAPRPRSSSAGSATSSTSAPTSGCPPATYEQWYGEAHGAPELLGALRVRDARAVPRRHHPRAPRRRARLLPDGVRARARAAAGRRAWSSRPASSSTRRRASPAVAAGSRRRACSPRRTRTSPRTGCSPTATRVRSSTRSAHVHGADVQVLFTPHLVPMTRGILADVLRAPRRHGPLDHARLLDVYREHYADEPFVVVADEPPATKATLGSNACHVTVRYDDRTGTVLALGAIDNLVKGASGQAIQAANRVLGLPETTGLSAARADAVSVTAVPGFEAAGARVRHQAVGSARPLAGRDHRPRAGQRGGRVHDQPGERRAGAGEPRAPGRRHARPPSSSTRATPTPRRASPVATTPGACASSPPSASASRRPTSWSARRGSSASRCRWRRSRRASPSSRACSGPATRPVRPRPTRCSRPTPSARRPYAEASSPMAVTLRVGGMAKGAAMLAPAMATMLAVVTTDAAIAPGALHTALEHAVDDTFNALVVDGCTSTNDTVLVLANGAAGNERIETPGGHAFHAFVEAVTERLRRARRSDGRRRRGRDEARADRRARRPHRPTRRAGPLGPWRAASSSSARSTAATRTGGGCCRSSARAARSSIPSGSTSRTTASPSAATASRRPHDETRSRRRWPGARSRSCATCTRARGEAAVRFTDLTHAYVDENMGTS